MDQDKMDSVLWGSTTSADQEQPTERDVFYGTMDIVKQSIGCLALKRDELLPFIAEVHKAVAGLAFDESPAEAAPAEAIVPAVPIKKSITPDAIISLEDGKPYKMLKRHLGGLGMTPAQYRAKWGLPADYPMTAANYAAKRSELAKAFGLGLQRRKTSRRKAA